MEILLKLFLLVYCTLFLLFAMLLPVYRVWRTTGLNPYKLGSSDSAHDYIGRNFRLAVTVCTLVIFAFVFLPSLYRQLLPIPYLSHGAFGWIGITLLLFALVWILTAQSQMQTSWRIGIDEDVRTDLVQRGLFKISRNPIFLGIRMMLVGLFLVLPNAVMLVIWVVVEILIQIQVRLEEEFLTRIHEDHYRTYQQQVRRWI
ncbi:MAG TPA: isoprenylcysteine carboxylmethyltransferase family protein [Anaerolineales bacterium]|nr:isoprenylcysteine carboxylmethyltransferase family protein [Anaerolineales bacterium]